MEDGRLDEAERIFDEIEAAGRRRRHLRRRDHPALRPRRARPGRRPRRGRACAATATRSATLINRAGSRARRLHRLRAVGRCTPRRPRCRPTCGTGAATRPRGCVATCCGKVAGVARRRSGLPRLPGRRVGAVRARRVGADRRPGPGAPPSAPYACSSTPTCSATTASCPAWPGRRPSRSPRRRSRARWRGCAPRSRTAAPSSATRYGASSRSSRPGPPRSTRTLRSTRSSRCSAACTPRRAELRG